MSRDPRILDDIARVAGGAVNIASGLSQQIKDDIQSRVEEMAARMDLVPREDLDNALAQIESLRAQQKELEERLAKLEKDTRGTKSRSAKTGATAKTKTAQSPAKNSNKKTGTKKVGTSKTSTSKKGTKKS